MLFLCWKKMCDEGAWRAVGSSGKSPAAPVAGCFFLLRTSYEKSRLIVGFSFGEARQGRIFYDERLESALEVFIRFFFFFFTRNSKNRKIIMPFVFVFHNIHCIVWDSKKIWENSYWQQIHLQRCCGSKELWTVRCCIFRRANGAFRSRSCRIDPNDCFSFVYVEKRFLLY